MQSYKTKSCDLQLKVDTSQRTIEGYFSAFGVKDSDGDVIPNGAFSKSVTERGPRSVRPRIKYLLNHDPSRMPGKLLELWEDNTGLRYAAQAAKTALGDEVLELASMGALNEHSIGYQTVKSHFDKELGANVLDEIKLWEGSIVTWGANEFTPVIGIKSLKITPDFAGQIERLAASCKEEELKTQLELLVQQLKAEAALEGKEPPDEGTPEPAEPQADAKLLEVITQLKEIRNLI
jgi:uncharacterized protein